MNHSDVLRLRESGKTLQEIANAFGVSRERIRQILKKHGIVGRLPLRVVEKKVKPTKEEKFWSHVDMSSPDGCWEWKMTRFHAGYGATNQNFESRYAHRVAWTLTKGEIPKGMCVCHKCDNPPCCNPDHLFLGTVADNMHDRDRKGRNSNGKTRALHKKLKGVQEGN